MAIADLAHPLEVAGRRWEAATRVLDRFEEHRGHRLGAFELDRLLDLVGGPTAERVEVVAVLGRAVEVRVGHLRGAGNERLEHRLHRGHAGERQGAVRSAVIGDVAADDLGLGRFAHQLVVLLGQLPGRLDRLAAAGGEEDLVEIAGGIVGQPVGQLDRLRVRVGPEREERQLAGLPVGSLSQLDATVAGVDDEQPGQAVQVALAVDVPDVGAVALDDGRNRRLGVGREPGEVHPEVVAGLGGQINSVGGARSGVR